jgi:2-polyprenyl-3-methyl-5-hydroxy-6-metoxy-1,4-benzoquinol methylase
MRFRAANKEGATMTSESGFDPAKAEAFAGKLLGVLNHGALCLMVSIGHRTGLFDAMRDMPPATPEEIAHKAGLSERYVREWLGALTTSGVIELDPKTRKYRLPPEHAAFVTRAGAPDNMAIFTQYVGILAGVEDDIVACFREGGGVPYARYPRFHAVMAEDSDQAVASSLEARVLPLVPGLIERLGKGIRVLDVGCGSGHILTRLAEAFPKSTFHGFDLSEQAIETARAGATAKGLGNLTFTPRDLSDFHETAEPDAYDLITTFDAVHDQGRPLHVLAGIQRALRSDGVYLMQEIRGSSHVEKNLDHPLAPFLYTVSCMHCMTVSLAQGGEGLGAMWGEEKIRDYLTRAGFRSIEKHELSHDITNDWYVVRR